MSNRIGPTVKHVWKVAMHVQHNLFWRVTNTAAYHLGPIQSSSPSTKELLDEAFHKLAAFNEVEDSCFSAKTQWPICSTCARIMNYIKSHT